MNGRSTTRNHSFAWLNTTQFFGALNDNVFQMLVIFFLTALLGGGAGVQASIMASAMIYFVLPFLLFSHAAGVLADRLSKRNVIVATKVVEVIVMLGGLLAIHTADPAFSRTVLYGMIFLMCTQSAFFGPSKYGIIPELVESENISRANGFLVGLTYLAIILGTFLPSFVIDRLFPGNYTILALVCVAVAVAGLLSSLKIHTTLPVGNTNRKLTILFPLDMFRTMRRISADKDLTLTIYGAAYFLYLGAFIKLNILIYGQQHLGLTQVQSGYLFPMAALGIGLGGLLAGRLSGRNIEFGIVPVGAAGLAACCFLYSAIPPNIPAALAVSFFVGISTGLFIVPLNSFVQYRSPGNQRGEILACQNFLSFTGVVLAAGTLKLLTGILHLSASQSFVAVGILTVVLAASAVIVLPDFLVRFIILVITRTVYRIKVRGIDNLPASGPALLAPNHVTRVDALLISATTQRRIRFLMLREIYDRAFFLKPIYRLMRVIPISRNDTPRQIVTALKEAKEALHNGSLVCIFPEGALTRNGNIMPFRPGMERIVKDSGAPIIPVHIGGAWGSIFSYYHGRLLGAFPSEIPYPASVSFGKAMHDDSTAAEVRRAVLELSSEAFELKKRPGRNLALRFVRNARRHRLKPAIADTTGKNLKFGQALTASLAVSGLLRKMTRGQDKVGVLLPSSVAGALVNAAIALLGKTSVNLNFTASEAAFESAIEQCGLRTIISSRAFLERLEGLKAPPGTVFMEDIVRRISILRKVTAWLRSFIPPALAAPGCRNTGPDDVATIIFSSGSTAQPKGIMLSHHNIISNIEQISDLYHFNPDIGICGILPFFHSFGFTVTLWCPLLTGARAVYHSNPVDASRVAEIVRENRLTMLLATPTFLLVYIRKIQKDDFKTLSIIIAGAEKLKARIADSFEDKFGIRPLEGYGTTELSPVSSINLPEQEIGGIIQVARKEGSIGHPVPGVTMKIVDPETGGTMPEEQDGMLMVKGPNVMLGYLNNPDKTGEALHYGWYATGDVARIDSDGFVYIVGRTSRFSKIAGEMVPHMAIEETLIQKIGAVEPVVFVTAAGDEKRGEQLVVLHTEKAGGTDDINRIIHDSDLPNLWKPRKDNIFLIDEIPTLGSGKLDLKQLNALAAGFVENKTGPGQKMINKLRETL